MGLLTSIRKRSKRTETATADSQRTANSWRSPLNMLHWQRLNLKNQRKQPALEPPNLETEDDHSISCLDLFQTLMSSALTAPQASDAPGKSDTMSNNNPRSLNYWHTSDPSFMPTAYPLTRTEPRSHMQPMWGSLNLVASAALVADSLKRFESLSNTKPKFHVGPHPPVDEDDGDERSTVASGLSGRSRSAIGNEEPRFAYISQDGKLVERETCRWPKNKLPTIYLRYKLCEPYASNYGKKAVMRASDSGQKFALPRTRWIYERPIFLLPRSSVNENKRRLKSRHMLKDRFEPVPSVRLPCVVSLNEREMGLRYREFQTLKCIRETKARLAHVELMKMKSDSTLETAKC